MLVQRPAIDEIPEHFATLRRSDKKDNTSLWIMVDSDPISATVV